ncbi:MAG: potassium-transporting ATPase, subunit [Bacteroidetes bacterium]|nr:potassium-transporting ATPase, subunit [Bacteroidota bacterium]
MKTFGIALKIFLVFTILTGIVYPLFVTGIAQVVFPHQANGSLILKDNKIIGSELIGQQSDSTIYFTSRPSAIGNNPLPSGGSNLGLTSKKLKDQFTERKNKFIAFNQLDRNTEVPSEMLFASASGLDPHISPEAAQLQINRIATARHLSIIQKERLKTLVEKMSEAPQLGCLGESRVNVLLLNIELDKLK